MKLIVQGKQMRVTAGMKRYAEEHLVRPLRRFYDNEAAELRVELGVVSKSRGEAKECHLTLHMPGARTIQIEESTMIAPYRIDSFRRAATASNAPSAPGYRDSVWWSAARVSFIARSP